MELDKLIETVDKYCVDYIRFILSVTNKTLFERRSGEFDNNLITFSIISVVLGDYIYSNFITHKTFLEADLLPQLVKEFSIWLAMSLLAYFGIIAGRKGFTKYTPVLTAVLRVMPAAFVLSCYFGVVVDSIAVLFFDEACAPWWAVFLTLIARSVILAFYLPFALAQIDNLTSTDLIISKNLSRPRARIVSIGMILLMLAIDLVAIGADMATNAKVEAAPIAAVIKLPKTDPKRLSVAGLTTDPVLTACLASGASCNVGALPHAIFAERWRGVTHCLVP